MVFRFIHSADWQLGKPFGQFDDGLSEVLRRARLEMIERLATLALEHEAPHVIVAGDVWDSEIPSDAALRQPLDIMAAASGVTWWLMPGNHDPAREGGLWTRIAAMNPASNIRLLIAPEAVEVQPGVAFLPAPWISKNPGIDNTRWMDDAMTPSGTLRIGIAHGSFKDFPGDSGQKCVIRAFERVEAAALDYLALGDWHGHVNLSSRIQYSGTPEIDSFPDNDPGWALCVEIASSGSVPAVTPLRVSEYYWVKEAIDILPGDSAAGLLEKLTSPHISRRKTLVRAALTGRLPLAEHTALRQAIAAERPSFAYFDLDETAFDAAVEIEDLDALDFSGSVRETAERLLEMKQDQAAAQAERNIAARALDLLFAFNPSGAS